LAHAIKVAQVDDSFVVEDELLMFAQQAYSDRDVFFIETPNIEQVVFDLQIRGYQVILAHPAMYYF